jgi:ribosomal protein S18 acetylase RimI-like enzyme
VEHDLRAWEQELARRWGLPCDFLRQGHIRHQPSDENRAIWSPDGGVILCRDENIAKGVADAIGMHTADGYARLLSKLRHTLREKMSAASCRIDVSLYRGGSPCSLFNKVSESVQVLPPGAEGLPDLPAEVEHVFAIRIGSVIASWASNIPQLKVDDHWLHSVGIGTHPHHRRKGLGKSVVSALVEHIAAEGGAALWVCEADNVPSLGLASSLGFIVHFCVLAWKVTQGTP